MIDAVQALRTGADSGRIAAAQWLGENPMPEAYPALVDGLGDPNPDVLFWAAWALARLGNPEALEPMRQAMLRYQEFFAKTHSGLNKAELGACVRLLMPFVPTQTLVRLLQQPDTPGGTRIDAAKILGQRSPHEAFSVLVEMLHERWHAYSVTAAEALVYLGDVSAVPHLEEVYAECKAVCAGGCTHYDDGRLVGVLDALLKFRPPEELQRLQREGDALEQGWAAQELERRSAGTKRETHRD